MKNKKWTAEELKYLKENWNEKTCKEVASDLNRTYDSVYMKARSLNLKSNKMNYMRYWTKEDEIYLEENWGIRSVGTLANNLKRTETAIILKVSKLELGPFLEAGGYLTLNKLMNEIMGDYVGKTYTIKHWIDKGLPVKNKRNRNKSFRVICLKDWWDWAERNSTLIDFSKLEPLVLGEEPKWLEEQRKADIERRYFKSTPWTPAEDKMLKDLLNTYRYTYRKLSLRMKRTEGALKRRMLDLDIKARPLRMSNHNPWTDKETKILIDLYHKGYCRNTMANYIDRSSQACSGKVERLIKEGVLSPRTEFRVSC